MVLWNSAWNVHVFPFCDPHSFSPSFPTPNCYKPQHCTSHTCHLSKHMKTTRFHGNGVRQTQNTSSSVLLSIIYRWLVHGLRLRTWISHVQSYNRFSNFLYPWPSVSSRLLGVTSALVSRDLWCQSAALSKATPSDGAVHRINTHPLPNS
jgi:hypothetical protein